MSGFEKSDLENQDQDDRSGCFKKPGSPRPWSRARSEMVCRNDVPDAETAGVG